MFRKSFCALLLGSIAFSQTPVGTITGSVHDPSGASVGQTRVVARNLGTNITREVASASDGDYTIPLLPPGQYEVSAEAPGFRRAVRSGVTLEIAQTIRVEFGLELGQTSDTVQVTDEAPLVSADSSDVGQVIENKKVVEMPLNGRQFFSLALLVPGTQPPAQGSTNSARGGLNVAGSGEVSNNFILNGINDNDAAVSIPTVRPSVDAIQEFKLLTGVYPAEYGYGSGGQIVVTTKSGSNEVHGTAFEYLRNQKMDARNFFSPRGDLPAFRRNQFGGTVGGPIRKDKTFAFFSYEGLRLAEQSLTLGTVPTDKMRAGDFSGLPGVIVRDPGQTAPYLGRTVAPPFAGNQITADRFNATGVALLNYFPHATSPTPDGQAPANNYTLSSTTVENDDVFTVRGDHTFSAKDSTTVSYNRYNAPYVTPSGRFCGVHQVPGFGCAQTFLAQLYSFSQTHIFSPNLVNEVRFGYTQLKDAKLSQDSNIDFNKTYNIPGFSSTLPNNGGVPQTTVTGYATLGGSSGYPQTRVDHTYDMGNNLIVNKGSHTLKFGVEYVIFQVNDLFYSNTRGAYTFTTTSTGPTTTNPIADMLLGFPATSLVNPLSPSFYPRRQTLSLFAQDDYKISRRLTVNLGLRYELYSPITDKFAHYTNFNLATGQVIIPQDNRNYINTTPVPVTLFGNDHSTYNSDKLDFSPRAGFSWQPFDNAKTVIRGGGGLFYNAPTTNNGMSAGFQVAPWRNPQTFTSTTTAPVTFSNPTPGQGGGTVTTFGIEQDFRNARILQWSFGGQHELARNLVLDVTYFGNKGTHLPIGFNVNQAALDNGRGLSLTARRPYTAFGNITFNKSAGNSVYNSLQVKLEKRYSAGLSFLTSYTYGRSIDESSGVATSSSVVSGAVQNNNYLSGERGRSDFDLTHRLVFSPVYELPFGSGRRLLADGMLGRIVGGFQLSSLFAAQSGSPFTAVVSGDNSGTGNNADRPDLIGNPYVNAAGTPTGGWINTCTISGTALSNCLPGQSPVWRIVSGAFGNEGRNVLTGPRQFTVDLSLVRSFKVYERVSAQFRAEFFNALNHTNFQLPLNTINTSTFGKITAANPPRQIQLAVRITF